MLLTKLKIAPVVLLALAVLGVSAAALAQRVLADKAADQAVKGKPVLAERPAGQPVKDKANPAVQPEKEKPQQNTRAQEQPLAGCGGDGALVKAIDVERNTITFDDKAPTEVAGKTFAVAADARITIDGKPGKLSDLPAGAFLGLGLSIDRKTILHFNAQGPQLNDCNGNLLEAVDVEKSTITFDAKARPEVAGKTFPVAPDARLNIDGKPGKLTGLPAGAYVNLTFSVDRKTVLHLSAAGPQVNDCNGSLVKAVDVENSTITFDDKARPEVAGKTFRVAQDAHINIDGKRGKLSGLPAGAYVNLGLSVDRKTILHFQAGGPQLGCFDAARVEAVDAGKSTVTFDAKAPALVAAKTFAVVKDTRIEIDGKPGKLADLPAGAFLTLGLSADRQTILYFAARGPEVNDCNGSLMTAVDAEKNTITFDDKARQEVAGKTFTVAKDANVNIDGKPGKLSGLPAGAFVNLTFSVDGKTVRQLNAQGPRCAAHDVALVKAVDVKKHTVTFDDKAPAVVAGKTFAVARDARISIDGKPGKLADLPPGAFLDLGLSADRQTILYFTAQGPQVR
jgi:hypothetical protein